jgi:hypothetical protein
MFSHGQLTLRLFLVALLCNHFFGRYKIQVKEFYKGITNITRLPLFIGILFVIKVF